MRNSAKEDQSVPVSRGAKPGAPRPSRRGRQQRFVVLVLVCLVVVAIAVLGVWRWNRRTPTENPTGLVALTEAPPVDMSRIEEPDPAVNQAIEAARQRVAGEPASSQAWGQLGMLLRAHGADARTAEICFAQAQRLDGTQPRWPYFRALSMLSTDADAALAALQRAAELCASMSGNPDIPRLKFAEELLARGNFDQAEKQFRALLVSSSGHARAVLGLARLTHLRGDPADAALTLLQGAADDVHTRKAAALLQVEIHDRKGEREQARKFMDIARRMPEDVAWPDPFELEVQRLQVGLKRTLSTAMALMRAGRSAEAIGVLDETRRQYPNSVRAGALLGLAYNQQRKWTEAEKVLREVIERAPDASNSRHQLGNALYGQARYAEAADSFAGVLAIRPGDAETHYRLGECYIRLGDTPRAIEAFSAAIGCKPDYGSAHREVGALLTKVNRSTEGLTHLRQALELNAADERARSLLKAAEAQQ